ncbi:LacI family DNA-binding transcriptional regulator [Staphylococcus xylosus]|uniref:LacI family DNA-binding transcriptional regulator n=1 Tax=Staphylococcus xylosus TaxID=1288 RepID=UPI001CDC7997|nr:LacI family DNA-binding transcriptional regulator [Staphylococcus xylosus]MCQ3815623.1 LacI family transcriptional regulator [Staphylococcus xylosus]MCQ3818326.1 LacI family transcriptional regulator [Staphylococcus xylosus]UBV36180.1 LacI family DNA-binding transcriptional regulator [Staphylococcus xylosus]
MVTIKDIAQAANVSPSTVSRVISGNPRISMQTREKVKATMKSFNYQPNRAARTLATKQSNTIGIIQKSASIEDSQNPFVLDVLSGIFSECKNHGYATISTTKGQSIEIELEVQEMIHYHSVDGFIVLYSKKNDPIIDILKSHAMPYVIIGKPLTNDRIIHIDNDNVSASQSLTRYIIDKGHNKFLFVAETGNYEVVKDRIAGHLNAIEQTDSVTNIVYFAKNRHYIRSFFQDLIEHRTLPTVVITSDTLLNHLILSVFYELKLHIPTDIQTATFNDSYLNAFASPPQTTVDIYPKLLGEAAAESTINIIQGHSIVDFYKLIPTTIIERESTTTIQEV